MLCTHVGVRAHVCVVHSCLCARACLCCALVSVCACMSVLCTRVSVRAYVCVVHSCLCARACLCCALVSVCARMSVLYTHVCARARVRDYKMVSEIGENRKCSICPIDDRPNDRPRTDLTIDRRLQTTMDKQYTFKTIDTSLYIEGKASPKFFKINIGEKKLKLTSQRYYWQQ